MPTTLDRGVVGQNEYVSNQSPSPVEGGTAISVWVESLIGQATERGRPGHATTMPHCGIRTLDYMDRLPPIEVRTLCEMRLRVQKRADSDWGWARLRVAIQRSPNEAWVCDDIRQSKLSKYELRAGIEDIKDWALLSQQARAARREWGHEAGFAEWTAHLGVQRFEGELLREVPE